MNDSRLTKILNESPEESGHAIRTNSKAGTYHLYPVFETSCFENIGHAIKNWKNYEDNDIKLNWAQRGDSGSHNKNSGHIFLKRKADSREFCMADFKVKRGYIVNIAAYTSCFDLIKGKNLPIPFYDILRKYTEKI